MTVRCTKRAVFFQILGAFVWTGGLLYTQANWQCIILPDSAEAAGHVRRNQLVGQPGDQDRNQAAARKLIRVAQVDAGVVITILGLIVFQPIL